MASVRHVSWAVRVACLWTCGLLFVLGVISYQARDRQTPPGASALVQITDVRSSEAAAVSALETVAAELAVNLLRIGADPAGPTAPPWYFVFIGDEERLARVLPGGDYPAFSPSNGPRIFDGAELARSDQPVRGTYALIGQASAAEVDAALAVAGLSAEVTTVRPVLDYLASLLQSSSWPALVATWMVLSLVIVHWVVISRRSVAVQQINGHSGASLVVGQLRGLVVTFSASALVVSAVGTALLWAYNGLNQYLWFIGWVLIPTSVVGIGSAGFLVAASALALRLRPLRSVSGARPVLLLATCAAGAQLAALVLVFVTLAQAVGGATSLASDTRTFDSWADEETSVTVQVNPNAFEPPGARSLDEDVATAYRAFADIVARLDDDGTAVLSLHQAAPDTGLDGARLASHEPFGGNSMIVNDNYLRRHLVVDPAGERIADLRPGAKEIHLLVPEALMSRGDSLRDSWANSTLASRDPYGLGVPPESYEVTLHPVADGQEVFNYGDTGRMENWTQRAPVIAVVSVGAGYLSPHNLLGVAANDGNLVFTDAAAFRALAEQRGLTERFSSISNPASAAAEQMRERTTRMIVLIGDVTIGVMVLVAAMLLVSLVYANTSRRAAFVKRTQGWSWLRVHWFFVTASLASSAAVLAIAVVAHGPAAPLPAGTALWSALGIFGAAAVVLVTGTVLFDRRARAELISQR